MFENMHIVSWWRILKGLHRASSSSFFRYGNIIICNLGIIYQRHRRILQSGLHQCTGGGGGGEEWGFGLCPGRQVV